MEELMRNARHRKGLEIGKSLLIWDMTEPSEHELEKARKELRETDEVKAEALQQIRLLLKGEPELHVPDDDFFLQMFLRPCKWYPKSAFQLMKRHYRFNINHPRISNNLVPSAEEKGFCSDVILILPERTKSGCRVVLVRAKNWKPKEVTTYSLFRAIIIALHAGMHEVRTQIAGAHVIFDMEGFSLSHLAGISPSWAAAVAEYVQKCLVCRLKGIHIVNQPYIFNMAFAIFKPFLIEKTRNRILFHGTDRDSLLSHINAEALPTYLGGEYDLPEERLGPKVWEFYQQYNDLYVEGLKYGYKQQAKG